jgi:hypothetical protein
MKITALFLLALASSLLLVPAANAQVTYTATDISGSTWEYNYTITNDIAGGTTNLSEFTAFFGASTYSNLAVVSAPSNWEGQGGAIAVQPDPILGPGFYDAVASDAGLAFGASQGGFSVEFTYLGTGTPGPQEFNFVDPNSFTALVDSYTTLASSSSSSSGGGGGTTSVPEIDPASTLCAMTFLLGMLIVMRGRKQAASRESRVTAD